MKAAIMVLGIVSFVLGMIAGYLAGATNPPKEQACECEPNLSKCSDHLVVCSKSLVDCIIELVDAHGVILSEEQNREIEDFNKAHEDYVRPKSSRPTLEAAPKVHLDNFKTPAGGEPIDYMRTTPPPPKPRKMVHPILLEP